MTRNIIAGVFIALVLLGPIVATFAGINASYAQDIPFATAWEASPLGSDHLGRNVAWAILIGGQRLVATAIAAGTLATILGTLMGCLSVLKLRLGFAIDAIADASIVFPAIIILLLISVLYPDAGLWLLITVVSLVSAPFVARVIAAAAYPIARSGYVQAAQGTGSGTWSVIFRDIIPNISGVLRSVLGLRIIEALYLLATASFLGVGSGLSEFAWSAMVRDNAAGITLNPLAVLAPAAMLAATSLAIMALLKPRRSTFEVTS